MISAKKNKKAIYGKYLCINDFIAVSYLKHNAAEIENLMPLDSIEAKIKE